MTKSMLLKNALQGVQMVKPVDHWALHNQAFLSFSKNPKSIPKCFFFFIPVKNLLRYAIGVGILKKMLFADVRLRSFRLLK